MMSTSALMVALDATALKATTKAANAVACFALVHKYNEEAHTPANIRVDTEIIQMIDNILWNQIYSIKW